MDDKENKTPKEENLQDNLASQPDQKSIIAEVPEESQAIPQKSIVVFPSVILLIAVSIFAGYLLYQNRQLKKALKINGFNDCIKEEGIIQESHPRVCVTKDGRRFTEEIKETLPNLLPPTENPETKTAPPEEENTATNSPTPNKGNQQQP